MTEKVRNCFLFKFMLHGDYTLNVVLSGYTNNCVLCGSQLCHCMSDDTRIKNTYYMVGPILNIQNIKCLRPF